MKTISWNSDSVEMSGSYNIWKVYISSGNSLLIVYSTTNYKNLKILWVSIFKNSKNQILSNCIIEEKIEYLWECLLNPIYNIIYNTYNYNGWTDFYVIFINLTYEEFSILGIGVGIG